MRTRFFAIALAFAVGVNVMGCNNLRPVSTPSFQVAMNDQKRVHEAVRQALVQRRWSIIAQRPDGFDAEYQRSAEMRAKVRITHAGDKVSIVYLDSSNLGYKIAENGPEIHKRYNGWVANLERDIQVHVGKLL